MLRIFKQYYPIRNIFFVVGEGTVIFLSVCISALLLSGSEKMAGDPLVLLKALLITVICQACLYYNDLYDLEITDTIPEMAIRLLQALGAAAILLAGIYLLFPNAIMGKGIFIVGIGFVILFVVSWRVAYSKVLSLGLFNQKIIMVGSTQLAKDILAQIHDRKDCGYLVAAVVFERPEPVDISSEREIAEIRKKHYDGLCELAKALDVEKIVVALKERRGAFPTEELLRCRFGGIEVLEGSSFYEMLTGKLIVEHIHPGWLIFSDGFRKPWARRLLKRSLDLLLSVFLLALFLPVFGVVAAMIKLDNKRLDLNAVDRWRWFASLCGEEGTSPAGKIGELLKKRVIDSGTDDRAASANIWTRYRERCKAEGIDPVGEMVSLITAHIEERDPPGRSIFFTQERCGENGRSYQIYKFRSMVEHAERISGGPAWARENDRRITHVGRYLRMWRFDELPQLWNVVKGEMSFVGPRPERPHFVRLLETQIPYYRERLTVKPGITGWAQVCYGYGADEDDAREKLKYDLFYIKNMSTFMDLMIVLRTIKIVLFGKGAR